MRLCSPAPISLAISGGNAIRPPAEMAPSNANVPKDFDHNGKKNN
jgi:hypothetical protein